MVCISAKITSALWAGISKSALSSSKWKVNCAGGDEFLIVSTDSYAMTDIARTKKKLQEQLEQTYAADDHLKGLSASIGISHSESGAIILDSLIGEADVLMYQEKSRKKAASS